MKLPKLSLTLTTGFPSMRRLGFPLFVFWLTTAAHAIVRYSTAVQDNALALCCLSAMLFAALAIAERTCGDGGRRIAVVFFSLMGACTGILLLAACSTRIQAVCSAGIYAAGIGLALHWGRAFSTLPAERVSSEIACALVTSGALSLLSAGAGLGLSLPNNERVFNGFAILAASTALLCSMPCTLKAMEREAKGRRTCSKMRGTPAAANRDRRAPTANAVCGTPAAAPIANASSEDSFATAASRPPLAPYVASLYLVSLLTAFMRGFSYLPHYANDLFQLVVQSGILLVAGAAMAATGSARQSGAPQRESLLLNTGILLSITGFFLLTVDNPVFAGLAQSALDAAQICCLCAAATLLCGITRTQKVAFFPSFAAGLAATGLFWCNHAGLFFKRLLGYDLAILAPLSTVCVSLLAAVLLLTTLRNAPHGTDAPANPAATGSADAVPASNASDARGAHEAADTEIAEAMGPTGVLGADAARDILKKTHEEVLATYALSPREIQVSLLMLDGLTIAAAAANLDISVATVKFHLGNAYRKLGIQSKAELVRLAKEGERPPASERIEGMPHVN